MEVDRIQKWLLILKQTEFVWISGDSFNVSFIQQYILGGELSKEEEIYKYTEPNSWITTFSLLHDIQRKVVFFI